jgi:hypothetical protein
VRRFNCEFRSIKSIEWSKVRAINIIKFHNEWCHFFKLLLVEILILIFNRKSLLEVSRPHLRIIKTISSNLSHYSALDTEGLWTPAQNPMSELVVIVMSHYIMEL